MSEQKLKTVMDVDTSSQEFKAELNQWKKLSEYAEYEAKFHIAKYNSEMAKANLRAFYQEMMKQSAPPTPEVTPEAAPVMEVIKE